MAGGLGSYGGMGVEERMGREWGEEEVAVDGQGDRWSVRSGDGQRDCVREEGPLCFGMRGGTAMRKIEVRWMWGGRRGYPCGEGGRRGKSKLESGIEGGGRRRGGDRNFLVRLQELRGYGVVVVGIAGWAFEAIGWARFETEKTTERREAHLHCGCPRRLVPRGGEAQMNAESKGCGKDGC
ncbi:hypothetical protein Tco_0912496 [Tanacetum coccineum]